MDEPAIIFRVHAVRQMFRCGISEVDVRSVLETGVTIEEKPTDLPYPSRLILGWIHLGGVRSPLHLAVSFDASTNTVFIITVYQPDPLLWKNGFRRRVKP